MPPRMLMKAPSMAIWAGSGPKADTSAMTTDPAMAVVRNLKLSRTDRWRCGVSDDMSGNLWGNGPGGKKGWRLPKWRRLAFGGLPALPLTGSAGHGRPPDDTRTLPAFSYHKHNLRRLLQKRCQPGQHVLDHRRRRFFGEAVTAPGDVEQPRLVAKHDALRPHRLGKRHGESAVTGDAAALLDRADQRGQKVIEVSRRDDEDEAAMTGSARFRPEADMVNVAAVHHASSDQTGAASSQAKSSSANRPDTSHCCTRSESR